MIEGTGSYGASLARALLADGFAVFECERPNRRRRADKNDLIDAEQAARRLLAGETLPLPRTVSSVSSCGCCCSSGEAPSTHASKHVISSRQRS